MRAFFEDENVLAFFTDRYGGVSKPPYDSLNVSFNVGDDIKNVITNRQIIADKEGFLLENLIFMQQVHGNGTKIIQNSFINEIKDTDSVITNRRKIALMAMSADCAAILMYDKKAKAIAAVHSGRNGTFKNIVKSTIAKMKKEFSCDPSDITVHVCPSIGKCCYEVGKEIVLQAKELGFDKYIHSKDDRCFLDLKSLIKHQLLQEGLAEKNIKISDICTSCDKNYFSYRRDGKTGRFCGVIMLK